MPDEDKNEEAVYPEGVFCCNPAATANDSPAAERSGRGKAEGRRQRVKIDENSLKDWESLVFSGWDGLWGGDDGWEGFNIYVSSGVNEMWLRRVISLFWRCRAILALETCWWL